MFQRANRGQGKPGTANRGQTECSQFYDEGDWCTSGLSLTLLSLGLPSRFLPSNRTLYNPRMQAIPTLTIALGSLLLISIGSNGGQKVQAPQPEKSKPPVKVEQRGRILGIGGIFFKSANRDQMREWYATHLGLADKGSGAMLPWREHDDLQKEHVTVWSVFSASTDYFAPGQPFMVNYIVDDLDALLDRLKQEGVKIDPKRMDESYGRFAWIYDPDGNKIELWQPSAKP